MKTRVRALVALFVGTFGISGLAAAAPLDFSFPNGPGSFGVTIVVPSLPAAGTSSGSGPVSGTLSADVTATPGSIDVAAGAQGSFQVADFALVPFAPPFDFPIVMEGLTFELSAPAGASGSGSSPFAVDLGGWSVAIPTGELHDQRGSGGLYTFFDFGAYNTAYGGALEFLLPAGTVSTLDPVSGLWTIPFTLETTVLVGGIGVELAFDVNLPLAVPEPGTALLLAIGLASLAGAARRRG